MLQEKLLREKLSQEKLSQENTLQENVSQETDSRDGVLRERNLQEKKKHGSSLFPFNIYPCTIPGDFPSVPLHWQESVELIYIKKGKGIVQIGMETMQTGAGDICVVPPQTLHALKRLPGNTMEYENIIFEPEFLGGGAADICAREYLVPIATGKLLSPGVLHIGAEGYEQAVSCLKEAEGLCGKREWGYELGVKAAMLRLIFLLLRLYPEVQKPDSVNTQRLKKVLYIVENEYMNEISVGQIADRCGCSASHFMRWFKEMTGTSFVAYLNERRLAAAARLLKETEEKILTIAQSVGFENLSNFNRQFKQRYEMTPGAYRKWKRFQR